MDLSTPRLLLIQHARGRVLGAGCGVRPCRRAEAAAAPWTCRGLPRSVPSAVAERRERGAELLPGGTRSVSRSEAQSVLHLESFVALA